MFPFRKPAPSRFTQSGAAQRRLVDNPLPDGLGAGMSLSPPEHPAHALTASMRCGADEDVGEVLQDRIAVGQPALRAPLRITGDAWVGVLQTQVGKSTSRARCSPSLSICWDSVLPVTGPKGGTRRDAVKDSVRRAEGGLSEGGRIAGAVSIAASQTWSPGRPQ